MEKTLLFISRRLLYLIVLMLVSFLLFAIIYTYPTTIQQRIQVVSEGGASPVFSPEAGYVVKELVRAGDTVKREQPLLLLQTPEGGQVELRSAADGLYTGERQVARMVSRGELLGSVIQADPLAVQMHVEPKQVGGVRQGMQVVMKLDALPYQKYGSLLGSVAEVSRIPSTHGGKTAYLVKVDVDVGQIPPSIREHYQMDLQGTAEIITGEQRLIAKLFPRIGRAGSTIH
jgi:multidrug efflux pump subunit AcrA (membrane-fusion protein)